jgi:hypothetical protein
MQIKYGIQTQGEFPAIVDRYKGRDLLILGSGKDIWKEMDRARTILPEADNMIINHTLMGLEWLIRTDRIKIQHYVSLHPEFFYFLDVWMKGMGVETHSNKAHERVMNDWPLNGDGSSGLFALKVALLLGYKRILICGVPLDDTPRFYDHPDTTYRMADPAIHLAWGDFRGAIGPEGQDKVRAMSGYPRKLYGEPEGIWARK